MILLNGQPLRPEDAPNDCNHASEFCFVRNDDGSPLLPSKMGLVCDYHYDLSFGYYDYDVEGFAGVEEYIKWVEAERRRTA